MGMTQVLSGGMFVIRDSNVNYPVCRELNHCYKCGTGLGDGSRCECVMLRITHSLGIVASWKLQLDARQLTSIDIAQASSANYNDRFISFGVVFNEQ